MKYNKLVLLVIASIQMNLAMATSLRSEQIELSQQQGSNSKSSAISPLIVGGSSADEGEYPFMSALVIVGSEIETRVTINSIGYDSDAFGFGPDGEAAGTLVDCGIGDSQCEGVSNNICLIERGDINFSEKALNCESGGGIGVIIYNNVEGALESGTLGDDFSGNIPVVAISQEDGQALLELDNATASISSTTLAGTSQDVVCGATFLGEQWVLTAAHCVDSEFADQYQVNVGEYNLTDGAEEAIAIKRIYSHPNYDSESFDNDVALIELVETVDATAIQLADADTTDQLAIENTIATSIGWGGRTGYLPNEGPTGNFPDILQEVELPLLSNTQCRSELASSQGINTFSTGITEQMICAALDSGGASACQGDSGGPLFVESSSGPLQVGITSWGIGCAAEGYPGVYARVGALLDFIDATRSGVGITGNSDITNSPVNVAIEQEFTVTNNSNSTIMPTISLSNDSDFSIDSSQCTTLTAQQSCQLVVTFNAQTQGAKTATITIASDVQDIPTGSINIQGYAVGAASELASSIGTQSSAVSIYSGGDVSWRTNSVGGVVSGNISGNEESILIAAIEGAGTLDFEWAVSSEENEDEPSEPFDALYLLVNGEEIEFISGEVDYTSQTISLSEGTNLVEISYRKDFNVSDGDDQGKVRNFVFTPTTPVSEPTNTSSGGGGTMTWLLLLLFAGIGVRRLTF
ncbi:trypsin-like serine protease [Aliiglaciecola sp. 3_MG-2023]|uniref:trypsin-like serine protease n=1 Tax=Aliiglaciecola sp. 3_MG-2023 TaxID=3062644 RepID=UPI0026E2FA50|nr:trypsin-like serine protease [Aliiglaciecola sp. 3_MG-2023]MDO6692839.1 trypsin-like serine protease [Aliiglaciecola sp. 3_MG-2023]